MTVIATGKQDPKIPKNVSCPECAEILCYLPCDVKRYKSGYKWIICPKCNNTITLEHGN